MALRCTRVSAHFSEKPLNSSRRSPDPSASQTTDSATSLQQALSLHLLETAPPPPLLLSSLPPRPSLNHPTTTASRITMSAAPAPLPAGLPPSIAALAVLPHVVTLALPSDPTTAVAISTWGATVLQWTVRGVDQLFLSTRSHLGSSKPARGGIPLVFPQFGPGVLKQHGFARNLEWTLERAIGACGALPAASRAREDQAAASAPAPPSPSAAPIAVFSLTDSPATLAEWPHAFRLEYSVELRGDSLDCALRVHNPSAAPLPLAFTALLHTYLRVPAIARVRVDGLSGWTCVDQLAGRSRSRQEGAVSFTGLDETGLDRIYEGPQEGRDESAHGGDESADTRSAPITVSLVGQGAGAGAGAGEGVGAGAGVGAEVGAVTPVFSLRTHGLPDVVVWNPGATKAAAMADMGPGEYRSMVCVEAGAVARPVTLAPGASWTGQQILLASSTPSSLSSSSSSSSSEHPPLAAAL